MEEDDKLFTNDDLWKVFMFYGWGRKSDRNLEMCPFTASVLAKIPNINTALFSILLPHKHVGRHRGPYKGVIRSHLPLIVPGVKGQSRIQVEDQVLEWEEGKVVVFDDARYHEAWNDTDEIRVLLMVDIVRPFPKWLDKINRGLIKLVSFLHVRPAFKKHKAWEDQFYAKIAKLEALRAKESPMPTPQEQMD